MAARRTRTLVFADESRIEMITNSIQRVDREAEVLRGRADEALAEVDRLRPDVVLIATDGAALRTIREKHVDLPIVAVVAEGETAEGATEVIGAAELDPERLAWRLGLAFERAECDRRLREAKHLAESASERKTEFLSSMSHEIRTPLNTVLGMAELLGETNVDDRQRGYVQTLKRASEHVLALVEDVLDIARIEAGTVTMNEVGFDLYEVAESAIDIVRVQARRKRLDLGWSVAQGVPRELHGDPHRLRQVLVNLLSNAVKFTESGRVWLSIARDEAAPPSEGVAPLHFSVTDTGIGIAPDKVETIFDGFVQGDRSIERRFGGFGLGLAIAKRIAARMNGRIWAESQRGKGSTFHVVVAMPVARGAVAPTFVDSRAGGSLTLQAPGDRRLRVLVVDDSEDNRVLLGEYLRGAGVDVEFAGDGVTAIQKGTSEPFDAVFMDLQMPQLDGYATTRELLRRARDAGRTPPPVIALSAHVLAESFSRSREAGATMQLTKPIRKRTLLDALARATGARLVEKNKPTRAAPREEILPLLPKFFQNRRKDVITLRDALARDDFRVVATLAHNMRGTGASYGFPELSAVGDALQDAGKRNDGRAIAKLVDGLEQLLGELESQWVKKPEHPPSATRVRGAAPLAENGTGGRR